MNLERHNPEVREYTKNILASKTEPTNSQMLKIGTLFCAKNWDVGRKIADTFFWSIVSN